MQDTTNTPDPGGLPDVGLDLLVIGIEAKVDSDHLHPLRELAVSAAATGFETDVNWTRGRPGHHRFLLPVFYDDVIVGNLTLDLQLVPSGGQLVTTGASSITINPQRILRRVLAWEPPEDQRRFDGNDNCLPLDQQGHRALTRELDAVEEIVATVVLPFLDELWHNAPRYLHRVWLKKAEACFDRREPDAVAVVRAAQSTLFAGALETHRKAYSRGAQDERGSPVVWWLDTREAGLLKAYAASPVTVRHEVACRNRNEVKELTGVCDAPFTPAGVRTLLQDFAVAAEHRLDRLRAHTAEAAAHGTMGEVVLALKELVRLASGQHQGRGRPPQPATVERARRSLDQMLATGYCDLTGEDPRGGLVKVLKELVDEGHATRHHTRQVYGLTPRLAGAISGRSRPA